MMLIYLVCEAKERKLHPCRVTPMMWMRSELRGDWSGAWY